MVRSMGYFTYLQMGYIGVTTHLPTFDPNFQQDIQVAIQTKPATVTKLNLGKCPLTLGHSEWSYLLDLPLKKQLNTHIYA